MSSKPGMMWKSRHSNEGCILHASYAWPICSSEEQSRPAATQSMHHAILPSLLLSTYGRDRISYWDPHVHRIFCTHSVLFGRLHQGTEFDGSDINVLYSGLEYSRGLLSVAQRCFS